MEDTEENHHRVALECNNNVTVKYFPKGSMMQERKYKNQFINELNPDYLYICAFVTRNIVGIDHRSKKLVEHSELQSGIPDMKGLRMLFCYMYEFYSIIYADVLLNASVYLQNIYKKRSSKVLKKNMPMLYYPYGFNPGVMKIVDIDYTKEKFKRFNGKTNFVFLGTVTRNYGAFTVLDAVKELKQTCQNFQMLILGKGRHYEEAKKYIADNNLQEYVFMPGFIEEEEISEYFSIASAFVSPMNDTVQDWARCPSKMYLYLPYRKPIITCRIGEPYEVLQEKGLYYPVGDSHGMANQMKTVICNKGVNMDVNPDNHSWNTRALELDEWLADTFK